VLAELLAIPIIRALKEAADGMSLSMRQEARLRALPPAMIPNNPVGAASVCAMLVSAPGL